MRPNNVDIKRSVSTSTSAENTNTILLIICVLLYGGELRNYSSKCTSNSRYTWALVNLFSFNNSRWEISLRWWPHQMDFLAFICACERQIQQQHHFNVETMKKLEKNRRPNNGTRNISFIRKTISRHKKKILNLVMNERRIERKTLTVYFLSLSLFCLPLYHPSLLLSWAELSWRWTVDNW